MNGSTMLNDDEDDNDDTSDDSPLRRASKRPRPSVDGPVPMGESAVVEYRQAGPLRTSSLSSPTLQLSGHSGSVYAVEYSPSGETLCSAGFDKTMLLWNHASPQYENFNALAGHKNAVLDCKWLDDETVVSCGADKTVQLFDANTGTRIKKWTEHTGIVNSVSTFAASASGTHTSFFPKRVASVSDDGTCRIWDTRQKRPTTTLETEFPVLAVALDGDKHVYTSGIDSLIHCWDLQTNRKTFSLKGHKDTVTSLSLHPECTHLLSNSTDHTLRTWDVRPYCDGKRHCKTFVGHRHGAEKGLLRCAWSLAPSSTNQRMVSCGSADHMVHIWDEWSAEEIYLLPGHKGCVNAVAFHPRENVVCSGASDKQIFVGELS
jgi:Prp8 binding protein